MPVDAVEKYDELSTEEIIAVIDKGRMEGCRHWALSGGEPMLRNDFADILQYILDYNYTYSVNTNGTLITSQIADLLKAKGAKMVSMYGPDAHIHDQITQNPGSFDQFIRGCRYLKEAGANFIVQLVPMQSNKHVFKEMNDLAYKLSNRVRIGATWLNLTADGDIAKNKIICAQRLDAEEIVGYVKPDVAGKRSAGIDKISDCVRDQETLFGHCIEKRNKFHIDAYGKVSFCGFIKDPSLRYDIKNGTFNEYWNSFLPLVGHSLPVIEEYLNGCGKCTKRELCRWCPAYAYLEHRNVHRKIDYLCELTEKFESVRLNLQVGKEKTFQVAGIGVLVKSDSPFHDMIFSPKLENFLSEDAGVDTVLLAHHVINSHCDNDIILQSGKKLYSHPGLEVRKVRDKIVYVKKNSEDGESNLDEYAVFNEDYSKGDVYHNSDKIRSTEILESLTGILKDEILFGQLLAARNGCVFHSSGLNCNGKGYLFIGHSGAGKSTILKLFKNRYTDILSEDRVIVKKSYGGYRLYGTWFHEFTQNPFPGPVELSGVFFLNQADSNYLSRIQKNSLIIRSLLPCVIRPLESAVWWENILLLLSDIAQTVPCYDLYFDKSGSIVSHVEGLKNP
ncbi:radical SAM protein [Desulfosediminicola flagellatus]|uniref:radical SAM protein n=1 Tax=Desulfosediminicola flagellatus TaxID=2569541 RepID=UPI00226A1834|nr:radical SAM protein [Desulfosediminicola flagellatus]